MQKNVILLVVFKKGFSNVGFFSLHSCTDAVVKSCLSDAIVDAGSVEFKGNDSESIDVPFFVWESILAATNNFSDSNMLGKGGFGAVYEVIVHDSVE